MHVGIDLGTTNSALAIFDGEKISVVPNNQGETLTPSVVRLDARGTLTVGRRAFRYLETDPANTRGEFKRLMGTGDRIEFEAAKKSLLPEELSAHVLSSLLADARDQLGFPPQAAVISTPALFELPQNHATVRAGKLAGLAEVTLIQEPIASAIAAGWKAEDQGLWLVFDLGGGTLDVSLLETKDNLLRVVDHWGDNFLGGKDFDNAVVDWAIERLRKEHDLPELARSAAPFRRAIAKLKVACEQAKIELSRAERAAIAVTELCSDASGQPVDADLELTRVDLESVSESLLGRCLAVCRTLLERNRRGPDEVGRVVFVGGPTLMPAVRHRIGGLFGGRVAEGIDPMTTVARGAALYAATAGVEARPRAAAARGGLAVRIEHPAVTADPEPYVVGRFFPGEGERVPAKIAVERADREFVSPETEVSAEGSFVVQVRIERHRKNEFRLVARDAGGAAVALQAAEFAIVHGVSVADPPLSRAVGVALADDTVLTYFEKGTPLPARRSFVHHTVHSVAAGGQEDALRIPVVQGEYYRAHRNRLIGTLQLRGVKKDLSGGARVEVTLHLDRSGQLQTRADVPSIGQTFEDVVHVLVPTASLETLEKEVAAAEERVADLRRRGFKGGSAEVLQKLEGSVRQLLEVKAGLEVARGADPDSVQRLTRLLLDLGAAVDAVEEALEWPELEAEADELIHRSVGWVAARGTPSEQQLFEQALAAAGRARKSRNAAELDRQLKVMRSLGDAAYARDPIAVRETFEWYAGNVGEATDVPKASGLIERGREALRTDDLQTLRTINRQLWDLFPATTEQRRLSFGSGVK